jgi:hypothetical protein
VCYIKQQPIMALAARVYDKVNMTKNKQVNFSEEVWQMVSVCSAALEPVRDKCIKESKTRVFQIACHRQGRSTTWS